MRKNAKQFALSTLRTLYFMFSASAAVWLIYNYAAFNLVTCGLLGLGAAYGLLTCAAALNVARQDKFLSGSSIDVLSVGTQKFLRIIGIAAAFPALFFCSAFALCVASFDGTTNAIERMKTVEGMELTVFGKSIIAEYIYGKIPTSTPAVAAPPTMEAAKDIDFGPYMATMQRRIKRVWFPPKSQHSDRARVGFKIFRDGKMTALREIAGSSKDSGMIKAGLDAVQTAAPFAPLPEGSPESVDIEFTFDYNVMSDVASGEPTETGASQ